MISKKVCMLFLRHSALDDRIYYKEAKTLLNGGYDVHLLCRMHDGVFTNMGGIPVGYPDENGVWKHDGITFHGIRKRSGLLGKWLEYKDLVRVGLSLKADVYHCHESDIALSAAMRIKKSLRNSTKLIYDLHEFGSASWKDILLSDLRNIVLHIFTCGRKKAINCSDYIITANTIVRGFSLVINRHKNVEILENGPILSIFKDMGKSMVDKNVVHLCHEGHLGFNRGLKEMVSLIENSAARVNLKIIGAVSGIEENWLAAKFKDNPALLKRIHITGWLPYEEVGNALSGSDIGLITFHPSVNNMLAGPPNKLYNYMRYGMPVVSVDLPETRAIISKYRCGIVVRDWNVSSIVQAIQYLIDNPEEAKAMGQRGKEAILNELSWERQGEKLLKVYESLLYKKPFFVF